MWHANKKVLATFSHHTTQWAWAYIDGVGWLRLKDGATDGCSNLFQMMNAARANDRTVSVNVDTANLIQTAYLF